MSAQGRAQSGAVKVQTAEEQKTKIIDELQYLRNISIWELKEFGLTHEDADRRIKNLEKELRKL